MYLCKPTFVAIFIFECFFPSTLVYTQALPPFVRHSRHPEIVDVCYANVCLRGLNRILRFFLKVIFIIFPFPFSPLFLWLMYVRVQVMVAPVNTPPNGKYMEMI